MKSFLTKKGGFYFKIFIDEITQTTIAKLTHNPMGIDDAGIIGVTRCIAPDVFDVKVGVRNAIKKILNRIKSTILNDLHSNIRRVRNVFKAIRL